MPITQVKNPVIANNTIAPAKLNVTSSMQTFLSSATSANLAATVSGTTGTGNLVFSTSPTLTTPTLTGEVTANIGNGRLIINKTSSSGTREGLLQCKISDAGNDTFQISNGTTADGRFIPTFSGYIDSTNSRESLDFVGLVSTSNDASNSSAAGIVNIFAARTSGSTDPVSGTFTSIQNRNLFSIAHNSSYSTESDFALIVKPNGVVVFPSSGNVGIGTNSPHSSSILDLTSTTRGFLPPRMTTAQRNAITSVPAGLMIYNTDTNRYNEFSGSAWQEILDSSNLGTNVSAFLATPTSANLLAAITDETGSGSLVFNTNPTFQGANVTGNLAVTGHFSAATKSFKIPHQTKEGYLQYGVVESNEHSVYVRGKTDSNIIELPEHWEWLVDGDSVTVQLTPIGAFQPLFVESCDNKKVTVGGNQGLYSYVVYGTRKDVAPLEIEIA